MSGGYRQQKSSHPREFHEGAPGGSDFDGKSEDPKFQAHGQKQQKHEKRSLLEKYSPWGRRSAQPDYDQDFYQEQDLRRRELKAERQRKKIEAEAEEREREAEMRRKEMEDEFRRKDEELKKSIAQRAMMREERKKQEEREKDAYDKKNQEDFYRMREEEASRVRDEELALKAKSQMNEDRQREMADKLRRREQLEKERRNLEDKERKAEMDRQEQEQYKRMAEQSRAERDKTRNANTEAAERIDRLQQQSLSAAQKMGEAKSKAMIIAARQTYERGVRDGMSYVKNLMEQKHSKENALVIVHDGSQSSLEIAGKLETFFEDLNFIVPTLVSEGEDLPPCHIRFKWFVLYYVFEEGVTTTRLQAAVAGARRYLSDPVFKNSLKLVVLQCNTLPDHNTRQTLKEIDNATIILSGIPHYPSEAVKHIFSGETSFSDGVAVLKVDAEAKDHCVVQEVNHRWCE